jgi:hypothetical protein
MKVTNAKVLGLFLGLGMVAAMYFGPASLLPKAAAQSGDPRLLYVFDNGNRYLRDQGNGRWAEYKNGKLWRFHKEVGRTDKFVELFTDDPGPTATRVFNAGTMWRAPNDPQWRQGSTGGWKDPNLFFP